VLAKLVHAVHEIGEFHGKAVDIHQHDHDEQFVEDLLGDILNVCLCLGAGINARCESRDTPQQYRGAYRA
jgi:hypothetical protein